jgi:hypothetical protein
MVDFMPNYQGRAWPEHKHIWLFRRVFRYVGLTGILPEECRHMLRYAGLTIWCVVQEQGRPDYPTFVGRWSGIYVQGMANGRIRDTEVS